MALARKKTPARLSGLSEKKIAKRLSRATKISDPTIGRDDEGPKRNEAPVLTADVVEFPAPKAKRGRKPKAKVDAVVEAGSDHAPTVTHSAIVGPANQLIDNLRRSYHMRVALINQKNGAITRAKVICREHRNWDKKEGAKLYADIEAGKIDDPSIAEVVDFVSVMAAHAASVKKDLQAKTNEIGKMAMGLPCAAWVKNTRGIEVSTFGSLIGITGDLNRFANPAKLWRYLGVGLNTDGTRQRKLTGALGIEQKYNPRIRSFVWNIGKGLIGGMGNGKRPFTGEDISLRDDWSPYEKLFVERLRIEGAKDPSYILEEKEGKESYSIVPAIRAKRYVEKRFLRDLWIQWGLETNSGWDDGVERPVADPNDPNKPHTWRQRHAPSQEFVHPSLD